MYAWVAPRLGDALVGVQSNIAILLTAPVRLAKDVLIIFLLVLRVPVKLRLTYNTIRL
jgi:hypothetical protein